MKRWVMRSVLPPTYAERSPMIPPRTEPMSVEATPTMSDTRAPWTMRE